MMKTRLPRAIFQTRTSKTALPPTFLLPLRARYLTTTTQHVEPSTKVPPIPPSATPEPKQPEQRPPTPLYRRVPPPSPDHPIALAPSVREMLPLLSTQPSHFITAHIHAKPYLVTVGDTVRLPFLMPDVQPGDILRLNRASVIGSRDYTLKGTPYVDERVFECRARVVGTESEPMRTIEKKKQRERRITRIRSKHRYTILRVAELRIKNLDEIEGTLVA